MLQILLLGIALPPLTPLVARSQSDAAESQKQDEIEALMPDTPVICSLITKHLGKYVEAALRDDAAGEGEDDDDLDESFVCLQLLKLSRSADFSDESGCKQMLSLLKGMLCSATTPDELVESCIRALAVAHRTETEYIERVHEIIAEVSDYDAESEDVSASDAAFRQLRIVSVVGVVLEHTKRGLDDPLISSLSDMILPAVTSADGIIREAGVRCLGKYALLGRDAAIEYRPLLLGIAANESEEADIRGQAMLAMCDLAMLWPVMCEETEALDLINEQMTRVSLGELLMNILDNAGGGLVVVAAEICCKLIMMGRIDSDEALGKLLVIYFDPLFATRLMGGEEDEGEEVSVASQKQLEADTDDATEVGSPIRLQQMLSLFFNVFVTVRAGAKLASSIKEVLRLVDEGWKAGGSGTQDNRRTRGRSKKGESVPLDKVVSFVGNTSSCGATVGLETCQYIVDASSSAGGIGKDALTDLVKSLSSTHVEEEGFEDYVLLREVAGDVDEILDSSGASKTVSKNFQKFIKAVEDAQDWAKARAKEVEAARKAKENEDWQQGVADDQAPPAGKGEAVVERERGVLSEVQA